MAATFYGLPLNISNIEVLNVPVRNIDPEIIRSNANAARQEKRIDVDYVSVNNRNNEGRVIAPHTLVFTRLRWHVRTWCEKTVITVTLCSVDLEASPTLWMPLNIQPLEIRPGTQK